MANAKPESIEIRPSVALDGRKKLKIYDLYISNCHIAAVEQRRSGQVKFRFNPIGAIDWSEAKIWLQGLLELAVHAEELENDE